MSKPRAILFDLDDTLISFNGVAGQAWETCCVAFLRAHTTGVPLGSLLEEIHKTRKWYWGDPDRHKAGRENIPAARREIVRLALQTFGIADEALICELADQYSALQKSLIYCFPSTLPVLAELARRGYRLGLVTNGSSAGQREKLSRFALEPYFSIILIEQEVGFGKPDVRIYEQARQLLSLRYEDLWMVGDNLVWDVQAPQSLGIYAVWYDANQSGLPGDTGIRPDAQIRDLSALLRLLA
jgi:putative hydrolase of the HAD superfamily